MRTPERYEYVKEIKRTNTTNNSKFFDPFSAFAAARELNGKQINGIVLNVYPHSN